MVIVFVYPFYLAFLSYFYYMMVCFLGNNLTSEQTFTKMVLFSKLI